LPIVDSRVPYILEFRDQRAAPGPDCRLLSAVKHPFKLTQQVSLKRLSPRFVRALQLAQFTADLEELSGLFTFDVRIYQDNTPKSGRSFAATVLLY
jgi:hypothetical protein